MTAHLLLLAAHDTQTALRAALADAPYAITATDALTDSLDSAHYDLLLVEISAENSDLSTLLTQAVSEDATPILLLSTSTDMEQVAAYLQQGAADYVTLPSTPALLQARIASILENQRLRQHQQSAEMVKIEQDIQIARRIQAGFLPITLPEPDGWQIAASFEPAREVAGDFYDAFYMSQERRIGVVIADVVDKGVPAALFMALVRSLVRAFAQQNYSLSWTDMLGGKGKRKSGRQKMPTTGTTALKNAVQLTNNYVMDNHSELNMFATLFFALINPRNGEISYINAGHNPPVILGADGTLKATLKPNAPAVGMFPNVDFTIQMAQIDAGDSLYLYTDGVTEARNEAREFFTEKRLFQFLHDQPQPTATALVETVQKELRRFIGNAPPFDDITMVAVRRQES